MSKPKKSKGKSKSAKTHNDERSYPNPYIGDPEPSIDYKVNNMECYFLRFFSHTALYAVIRCPYLGFTHTHAHTHTHARTHAHTHTHTHTDCIQFKQISSYWLGDKFCTLQNKFLTMIRSCTAVLKFVWKLICTGLMLSN